MSTYLASESKGPPRAMSSADGVGEAGLKGGREEHLTLASHYLFVSRLAAHSKKLSRIVGDHCHDNFFHFDGEGVRQASLLRL